MNHYKQAIGSNPVDTELSALKFAVNNAPSREGDEESFAVASPQFDPQVMEAFLKFLEAEWTGHTAGASAGEAPAYDLEFGEANSITQRRDIDGSDEPTNEEPTNGWPGYPFL